MVAGKRTAPEVEAEVVRLVREGKTRRQVSEAAGVSDRVVSRIVRDTPGVEFARIGQGSSGTPEAMARARGVQSEYARNRRAALYSRTLDEYERTLDLLSTTLAPRERQMLSQALAAKGKAASDISAMDAKAAPDLQVVVSMFDRFMSGAEAIVSAMPAPRPGLIQE